MVTNSVALFTHFQHVNDPRIERRKRHSLYEMIGVTLCGTLRGAEGWVCGAEGWVCGAEGWVCGAEGWVDIERFGKSGIDWFRKFLNRENSIPSHDTFGRVFGLLDSQQTPHRRLEFRRPVWNPHGKQRPI